MNVARWSISAKAEKEHYLFSGEFFLFFAFLGILLSAAAARAGGVEGSDRMVLANLAGLEPLPVTDMAKGSARGHAAGSRAGVDIPVTQPTVRLWDDFGAFSLPAIGNTVVTISTGSTGQ
jgi:hypothetical protein